MYHCGCHGNLVYDNFELSLGTCLSKTEVEVQKLTILRRQAIEKKLRKKAALQREKVINVFDQSAGAGLQKGQSPQQGISPAVFAIVELL